MKIVIPIVLFFLMSCSSKIGVTPAYYVQTGTQNIPVIHQADISKYIDFRKEEKVQVINFWATWCAPCVQELPEFERLNAEQSQLVDVRLISLDFEDNLKEKMTNFLSEKEVKSTVAVVLLENDQEFIEMVSSEWNGVIPATLITYKDKQVFISGKTTYDELLSHINTIKLN